MNRSAPPVAGTSAARTSPSPGYPEPGCQAAASVSASDGPPGIDTNPPPSCPPWPPDHAAIAVTKSTAAPSRTTPNFSTTDASDSRVPSANPNLSTRFNPSSHCASTMRSANASNPAPFDQSLVRRESVRQLGDKPGDSHRGISSIFVATCHRFLPYPVSYDISSTVRCRKDTWAYRLRMYEKQHQIHNSTEYQ